MEKFLELHDKLSLCYSKIHFLDYIKLSDEDKDEVCNKEKSDLRNYLSSDNMSHKNILEEKLSLYESNIIFKIESLKRIESYH
jgi:hypothetical protein